MNDMLERMRELSQQPVETPEEDESPSDILGWCLDQTLSTLEEIKIFGTMNDGIGCATLAISATSNIKQQYIRYLEQRKIWAALKGDLDFAGNSKDDFYVTYADDEDGTPLDEIEDDEDEDFSATFMSSINTAMNAPTPGASNDQPKEDPMKHLERGVKRAVLSFGEIEIMGQYGRNEECVREAEETIARINVLRERFEDATRIVLET